MRQPNLRPPALVLAAALALPIAFAACAAAEDDEDTDPTPAPPATVVVTLDEQRSVIGEGSCIWYEGREQLVVEAGSATGADHVVLAAPLTWLGVELPEGPGVEPELELRLGGDELVIDETSLTGEMTEDQARGTFRGLTADGARLTGSWECPEILEA